MLMRHAYAILCILRGLVTHTVDFNLVINNCVLRYAIVIVLHNNIP